MRMDVISELLVLLMAKVVYQRPGAGETRTRSVAGRAQRTNLLTEQPEAPRDDLLPVNHANGLTGLDRNRAIGALLALVRAGYRFEVDALISWARPPTAQFAPRPVSIQDGSATTRGREVMREWS
jgi:hypothetical protein